ncbi:MAG: hypothetical protein KF889_08005 [Alphaproteobacteria bacterium]|nr:hypothetical protein [Alphaproteobacteria bacterium]MCW5740761.1 hypothetical protein [Alphaproteobacteria bacterium]
MPHSTAAARCAPLTRARRERGADRGRSFMVPGEDVDLARVLERAAAAVRRFDADVLVIDSWNEMDHVHPPDMSLAVHDPHPRHSERSEESPAMAHQHRVHLIVVAHPAKLLRARDSGRYPTPSLYDIADSAHWANKPDIGVVIHRESLGPDGTTTIKVAKVRYCGVIDTPGEVTGLKWNREATRYEK